MKSGDLDRFIQWLGSIECQWFDPNAEIVSIPIKVEGQGNEDLSTTRLLDPDRPIPLDGRARSALEYWDREGEYNKVLEETRVIARDW